MMMTEDGEELIVYANGKADVDETIGRIAPCACPACRGERVHSFPPEMQEIIDRVTKEVMGRRDKLH